MPLTENIVIVGAGHAGGTAAALLRQHGWQGSITLVGDEPVAPYQHPPLSKAWLTAGTEEPRVALRPDNFYIDKNIGLRLDTRAIAIDRIAQVVILESGERIAYGRLILATGCRARRLKLPGFEFTNVLALRSIGDARQLKTVLQPGRRLAIIGGGYIGLEVAASARTVGAGAVVIERESRLLARVASPRLSSFFHDAHRARGVEIELDADVMDIAGHDARATGVRLADGRTIACDAVLVGVGAAVNEELAADAGLVCENGIVVDQAARTSDPGIYAIGDCTRRPLPLYGQMWRLESVPNALEQAKQAAADICGVPPPVAEVPWFWSDQFDIRLQIAGLPLQVEKVVVRGDLPGGRFAVYHLSADHRIQAVESINLPLEFMVARQLIANRTVVAPEKLADQQISVKEVAA